MRQFPRPLEPEENQTSSWHVPDKDSTAVQLNPRKIVVNPLPRLDGSREQSIIRRGSSKRRMGLSVAGHGVVLNQRLPNAHDGVRKRFKHNSLSSEQELSDHWQKYNDEERGTEDLKSHEQEVAQAFTFVHALSSPKPILKQTLNKRLSVDTNGPRNHNGIPSVRRLPPVVLTRETPTTPLQIESKGQQATLFARFGSPCYLGSPPKDKDGLQSFNLRSLARNLNAPPGTPPGTPDSGTSSLDSPFTFRAKSRSTTGKQNPTGQRSPASVTRPTTVSDPFLFRDVSTMPPFPRKRGASISFDRMMRSSFSSLDGLQGMMHDLGVEKPCATTTDDTDDNNDDTDDNSDDTDDNEDCDYDGPHHHDHYDHDRNRFVLDRDHLDHDRDHLDQNYIDDLEMEMAMERMPPMPDKTIHSARPSSNESTTRSDLGSSTFGSRPSSADVDL